VSWVTEPWATELVARAGIELILVGILGGALGVFVVVRGLPFTVEAFSHTVFPGAVLASALGGSIVAGALAASLAAAVGIAFASRTDRTSDETATGVVFTGMFALGALLASALGPLDQNISTFLFGDLLGVTRGDLLASLVIVVVVLGTLGAIRRPLIAGSFDRDAASASGMRPGVVDVILLCVLALAVVVAIRAVGTVLVLALFVTPAASARLIAHRLGTTIAVAIAFGIASGLGGLYLSYYADVAAGGAVVLVASGMFVLTWLVSPRTGLLGSLRRASAPRPAQP
jgi:manganese/iron transport system permease protein